MGYSLILFATVVLLEVNGALSLSFKPTTCTVEGKRYNVGERFISPSCKGRCTCHPWAIYKCTPLCPPIRGMCRAGTTMTAVKVKLPNSKCACARLRCVKRIPGKGCVWPCTRIYKPVCGSNGSTYSNMCILKIAGCKSNGKVALRHEGKCKGRCQQAVAKVNRWLLGAFIPKCKPDGSYQEKQCHGSTGHCWCVEPSTGKEIVGSRRGPGKSKTICHSRRCPPCAADYVVCKPGEKIISYQLKVKGQPGCSCRRHKCSPTALGRCQQAAAKVNRWLMGAFIPKCKPDGSYQEKQCHGSTGHCWCVVPSTGKEIVGSRRGPGRAKANCEMCRMCMIPKIICRGGRVVRTNKYRSSGCYCPQYKCVGRTYLMPPYRISSKDCWGPCKNKGGRCDACGDNGYCCRKGWSDCPVELSQLSGNYHSCIRAASVVAAGYCLHKGKKYLKGQRITIHCNSCTCMVGRGRKIGGFACTRRACARPVGYCLHKGRKYWRGQRISMNCNKCTCMVGSGMNVGRFACTMRACPRPVDCTSPQEAGGCEGLIWKWNYNPLRNTCNLFAYGGCGGNRNRYNSQSGCMSTCGRKSKVIRRASGYGGNWRWSLLVEKD